MMPSRSLRAFALVCALVLAGCGDDAGDGDSGAGGVIEELGSLSGAERERELKQRARDEPGRLRFYTSLDENFAAPLVKAFERAHGVRVDLVRANNEEILQRVAQEARAGASGADIVETGGHGLVALQQDEILTDFEPPALDTLIEGSKHDGWTASRYNTFVVSRNTEQVAEDERPRSHADLADPKWRDRILMEVGDFDWYVALRDHWVESEGLTEEEADARFEAIARNARAVDGHSLLDQLVGSGEFDVGVSSYSHIVDHARGDGAPIDWRPPVAPIVRRPNGVAVLEQADHPAKALLFVDWLLSDGQEVLARLGANPARKDLVKEVDAEVVELDPEAFFEQQEEAAERYREIIELAGKGPEEEG